MAAAHAAAVIVCYVQGKNVRQVRDFDLTADPIGWTLPLYGILLGWASLIRPQGILLIPAVFLGLCWGKRARHALIICGIGSLGWIVFGALKPMRRRGLLRRAREPRRRRAHGLIR